jgi:hypothetical protein
MQKRDRFLMETYLMDCWHITDDLDVLAEYVGDTADISAKEKDTILNMLIGLKELYHLKHQRVFSLFEEMIHTDQII